MMLFLDTEFSDMEAKDNSLISLALVREDGEFIYAELPIDEYQFGASPWVRNNVLPLLWGGAWVMDRREIQRHLLPWIEAIDDRVMICTDAPEFDFEFLKPLLHPWPGNLAKGCLRFDSLALGINRQAAMLNIKERFFKDNNCPEHHALHDAQALMGMFMFALGSGWRPS